MLNALGRDMDSQYFVPASNFSPLKNIYLHVFKDSHAILNGA